ncbi:MAG: AzlC family ABC transporter permease [Haliea sp.]|tara:strand:- start:40252 stop:40956 length:705 start_codon:yes stop_codon:yes gene_type:complete
MSHYTAPELSPAAIRQGFWRLLPISLFVAVFGAAFGLAAVQAGLPGHEIVLMSATVFAGTAQFAALELWGAEVPLLPLLATTFAINARMLLMGATLYPWMALLPPGRRYGSLVILSDANWAMNLNDLQNGRNNLGALVGGGLALWLTWLAGTILGMVFGSAITDPKALGVDMVMGCFMLSMVLAGRRTSRTVMAWVVGGAAAYAAWLWLPENSHVVVGALAGGLVGALWLEDKA